MAEEPNPFMGVPFAQGVKMLRADPGLASKFDEVYTDEEEASTLRRAELHIKNAYYRGSSTGALALSALSELALNPPKPEQIAETPTEEAAQAAAQRLRRGVIRQSPQERVKAAQEKYDGIVGELGEYERMAPAEGLEYGVALGGALIGSFPSLENLAAWPIKGATVMGRMFWGGLQAGAVNTAADPVVQALNIEAQVRKEYDWTQTALAFPMGAVIGGGLVGAGEVITRSALRNGLRDLSRIDPAVMDNPQALPPQRIAPDEAVVRPEPEEVVVRQEVEEPTVLPEPRENPPLLPSDETPITPMPVERVEPEQRVEPEVEPIPEPRIEAPAAEPAPKPLEWEKIGEQKGSNPGGLYKDALGTPWYVKTPKTEMHIDNEVLGNHLYDAGGVYVPPVKKIKLEGQPSVASAYFDESKWVKLGTIDEDSPAFASAATALREDFAMDAWLANWDVIGLTRDNILVNNQNPSEVLRIDQGGSLMFRAQGAEKPSFGKEVLEFESMRNPSTAPEASQIYGEMTSEELIKSIDKVAAISPEKIDELTAKYAPLGFSEILAERLKARRQYLIDIQEKLLLDSISDSAGKVLSMTQQARWARAKAMGFLTGVKNKWLHGTAFNFDEFDLSKYKAEKAIFLTKKMSIAQAFANAKYGAPESVAPHVLELFHRAKNIKVIDPPYAAKSVGYSHYFFKQEIEKGHADGLDAILFKNVSDSGGTGDQLAVLKPSLLRSTKAAFDPTKKESAKLAALEGPKSFDEELEDFVKNLKNDELFGQRMGEAERAGQDLDDPRAFMHPVPLQGELTPVPNYTNPPNVVQSLQQMVNNLAETFGDTIRQGKTGKALGHFNTQTGLIYLKEYPDFAVATHEVAHSMANKLTGSIHLNGTDGLSQIAQGIGKNELMLLDYDQDPILGQRVSEGFAEYIRLFMTSPAYMQAKAPAFTSAFVNYLEQNAPKYLEDLVGFQQAYKNYLAATPEQLSAVTMVTPKRTWGDKVVGMFTDAKVAPTIGNVMSLMYDAVVHKDEDWFRATREIAKAIKAEQKGMVDLLPTNDPRVFLRMLRKSTQTAMAMARDGVVNWANYTSEGPSIKQALGMAMKQSGLFGTWDEKLFQEFGGYMIARRLEHLWEKHARGELSHTPHDTLTPGVVREIIARGDAENPQFRQASDMIHEFNRNYLKRMSDSGAIYRLDEEARLKIEESEPFYVPLNRDLTDKFAGKGGGLVPGRIHAFKGSMRDFIHPVVSMMDNLARMEQQIAHAQALRAMRDLALRAKTEGGKFLEMVPAHEVRRIEFDLKEAFVKAAVDKNVADKVTAETAFQNVFGEDFVTGVTFKSVVINGQRHPVAMWADGGKLQVARLMTKEEGFGLYNVLNTLPPPSRDIGVQIAGFVSNVVTGSITTHWLYALRNIFRDQFAAMGFVPGYIPFYHAIEGAVHIARNDEYVQKYRQMGGVNPTGGILPKYADTVEADVQDLMASGFKVTKVASFKGLMEAISSAELATRIGATVVLYRQKKRSGLSDNDAWLSTINETADLLPFDRVGGRVDVVRHVIPFLNAFVQSMSKASRSMAVPVKRGVTEFFNGDDGFVFKEDSREFKKALHGIAVFGVGFTGLGMAYAALMEGYRSYTDASARLKGSNLIIPLDDERVFVAPKPWELSLGFTAGEYMYAKLKRNDPRAAEMFMQAVRDSVLSPNLLFGNPLVGTTSDIRANYNSFTGGPIVPPELAKQMPEFRYDATTSGIAKALGKATAWAEREVGIMTAWPPKKVDYAISGYMGYWGRDLTTMAQGNTDEDATANYIDAVINRAGIRDSAGLSDAPERFWKHISPTVGAYTQAMETYKRLTQNPERAWEARELYNRLSPSHKAWTVLHMAAKENGKQSFDADDRRAHALQRGYEAATVSNVLRKAILNRAATESGDRDAPLIVNVDIRKKVSRVLGQLSLAEMTNALNIIGEPGYAGRALIDPNVYMEQLRVLDPRVAEELAKRYATKKIYKTEAVAKVYEDMKSELVARGSQADIANLVYDVKREGYEFDAPRQKRTPLRRTPIEGTVQ